MNDTLLLEIARKSIEEEFVKKPLINKDELLQKFPNLAKNGAVFVTLTQNGNLRGCIGSLIARRSLLEDLISHAKNAAFEDPRFLPLSKEEFEKTDVEISLLSETSVLNYSDIEDLKSKIKPNVHGVILQLNGRSATFLPQVWEQLPSFELFFSHLCQKAGLRENCLQNHPQIFTYTVRKISS